jgi:hypothetical protein
MISLHREERTYGRQGDNLWGSQLTSAPIRPGRPAGIRLYYDVQGQFKLNDMMMYSKV